MAKEIEVRRNEFIVSETDKYGNITNVNPYFLEITGYKKEEVIGKPHNILRHKDMPKTAFEDMWETIESGKTWRGFVKNKCKSGDYYWVYATVSPVERLEGDTAYTSIRQRITKQESERYQEQYDKMREAEDTKNEE